MMRAIILAAAMLAVASSAMAAPRPTPKRSAPKPAIVKTFKDWSVACDNGYRCEATSHSDDYDNAATVFISRKAGNGGELKLRIRLRDDTIDRASLYLNRRKIYEGQVSAIKNSLAIDGRSSIGLIRAMARGATLNARSKDGTLIGKVSLAGASAALRYMDDKQYRVGSKSAFVARGPAIRIPRVPAPPNVKAVLGNEVRGLPKAEELEALVNRSLCREEMDGAVDANVSSLGSHHGKDQLLILIECGRGAYNMSSVAYLADRQTDRVSKAWRFRPMPFDYLPSGISKNRPMLINAGFDESDLTLSTASKGRGLGDCGSSESYVWNGTKFRLYEATLLDTCRGSTDWLTIWRANIVYE